MNVNNSVATVLLMMSLALGASAFAGSAPVTTPAAKPAEKVAVKPVAKPAAPAKKAPVSAAKTASAESKYARCMREKAVVAKTYCDEHPDSCEVEKKGIKEECDYGAHGKRHTTEVLATGSH